MKQLIDNIQEKLIINKHSKVKQTYYVPKSKDEFLEYINLQKKKAKISGTHDNPVDLSYIDFSELIQYEGDDEILSYLFYDDNDMEYLDMSYCKFNNAKDIGHMFEESQLREINITGWELYDVDTISGLFEDCQYLTKIIGIEDLDILKVKKITVMFAGCLNLEYLDLSKWDVSNITRAGNLFRKCYKLKDIGDLSKWNLQNVERLRGAFAQCFELKTIKGIDKWKLPNIQDITSLFLGDAKLDINIDSWNLSPNKVKMNEAFDGTNIQPSWAI